MLLLSPTKRQGIHPALVSVVLIEKVTFRVSRPGDRDVVVMYATARVPSVILRVLRCFEVYSHSEAVLGVRHWLRLDLDSLAGAQDSGLDGAV